MYTGACLYMHAGPHYSTGTVCSIIALQYAPLNYMWSGTPVVYHYHAESTSSNLITEFKQHQTGFAKLSEQKIGYLLCITS